MGEIEFIADLFNDVGAYVRAQYTRRAEVTVSEKTGANDLLTEVDVAVQRRVAEAVALAFPGDIVVGEELGMGGPPDDPGARCWIIDPIDGTQNFVRGLFPLFGISVAFAEAGVVQAGGVAFPVTDDVFLAARDLGATHNGRTIRVSLVGDLGRARIELDFSHLGQREQTLRRAHGLFTTVGQLRCHSSAVLGLCSVAAGEMEGFFHVGLAPWDYAAGALLVEEAGGRITRLDGTPLELFDGKHGVLASNGVLHHAFLERIAD